MSSFIVKKAAPLLPKISSTEKEALVSGTVTLEGDFFKGKVDWNNFFKLTESKLTDEEESFIANEVEQLLDLANEFEAHKNQDISPQEWQFIREKGFLGLIIPKEFGGKGFSHTAHSRIVEKIATHSPSLAVTVMVPNSLGPAELLLHYGLDEQKNHYLPRLAAGKELPCFGLTGHFSGSDAASMPDKGIVLQKDGQLFLSVTVSKRYITLAPVASLVGLAFNVFDPENLLGKGENPGITLALVPRDTPGLEIGKRHKPLFAAFMNGTVDSKDMLIPLNYVIGGKDCVGKGWAMLMECLAVGRAISLPSMATASIKHTVKTVSAYASLRKQFKLPISKFHGVAMPLGEAAIAAYWTEAALKQGLNYLDNGDRSSVASGILKYHLTEASRGVVNDGMDIVGGKGICQGESNFLGFAYQYMPIGITVEGANIMTRNLIIYGQGLIRCHPYMLSEVNALESNNGKAFTHLLRRHVVMVAKNVIKNLFRSFPVKKEEVSGVQLPDWVHSRMVKIDDLARMFSIASELSVATLGGGLKKEENSSARLGDAMSHLYFACAVLRKYLADQNNAMEHLAKVCVDRHLAQVKFALIELEKNFPNKAGKMMMKLLVRAGSYKVSEIVDLDVLKISKKVCEPGIYRNQLIKTAIVDTRRDNVISSLEKAMLVGEMDEKQVKDIVFVDRF